MKMGTPYKYVFSISVFGVIAFFLFGGFIIGLHKLPSYGFFRRVELNLFGRVFERMVEEEAPEYYDSIFLRLYDTQTDISDRISREGRGGGLTSFGDAVLLLTHDGQVLAVRSADDIRNTDVTVPDNGFQAYKQVTELEQYKNLSHNFKQFRYNDILFYESERHRGLAVSYTDFDSTAHCYRNTIAVLPVDSNINSVDELTARPGDWNIIYRSKPCLPFKNIHYALEGGLAGGRMAFRGPSTIYFGNGDYHWDGIYAPEAIAQKPESEYGKIMKIDLSSQESHIVATGIRNPQGIVFDENDNLWIVEHGLRGGDELNRIKEGINYGWPVETLGTQYSKLPVPNSTAESYGRHNTYKEPVFAWLPSVAISNLTLIKGFHSSWDGDLLMGSLKSMSLFHIRIKDDRVLFSEKIEIGNRIRYVHQHTDGRIILWTDSKKLIFLTGKPYTDNYITDYLEDAISNESLRERVKTTIDACRQCHAIEPGDHTGAPSLAAVFNAEIGSTSYENYSDALKENQGIWTRDNLKKFLSDPQQFAPGTVMPDPGISDEAIMEEIVNLMHEFNKKSRD
ncbi:PQQ-dependent sugar dehydrogenase [Fodinibius sediminis]|nr:PQQ-dependent sugar dehydrogenase [Fodinibius sediminis]